MTPATCALCHTSAETAPAAGLRAVVPGCVRCALLVERAVLVAGPDRITAPQTRAAAALMAALNSETAPLGAPAVDHPRNAETAAATWRATGHPSNGPDDAPPLREIGGALARLHPVNRTGQSGRPT